MRRPDLFLFVFVFLPLHCSSADPGKKLMTGILRNDPTQIEKALAEGADINKVPVPQPRVAPASRYCLFEITEERGFTPLIWALEFSDQKTVDGLVSRGAKPKPDSPEAKALLTLLEASLLRLANESWMAAGSDPGEIVSSVDLESSIFAQMLSGAAFLWSDITDWSDEMEATGLKARIVRSNYIDPFGHALEIKTAQDPVYVSEATRKAAEPFTSKFKDFWGQYARPR